MGMLIKLRTQELYKRFLINLGYTDNLPINIGLEIDFKKLDDDRVGEFIAPGEKELEDYINSRDDLSYEDRVRIENSGLIFIDSDLVKNGPESRIISTGLHELIHASRIVLTNLDSGSDAIVYHKGVFIENGDNKAHVVDPTEIFWGNVDTSENSAKIAKKIVEENEENLNFGVEYDNQLSFQARLNEALTELTQAVAYRGYLHGESILESVSKLKDNEDEDISAIARIILRHNDDLLFRWFVNPLEYQGYDLRYDFFKEYITEADLDDVGVLYELDCGEINKIRKAKIKRRYRLVN